jgi:hypothetical protein
LGDHAKCCALGSISQTAKPPRADAFPLPAFKNPIKSTYMLNTPHVPIGMKTDPSDVRIAGGRPSDVNGTMRAVLVVEIEGDAVQL